MVDALYAAVYAGDQQRVADTLRGMPERERRALAPRYVKLARGIFDHDLGPDGELKPQRHEESRGQSAALALATVGTLSLTELRRVGAWIINWSDAEFVLAALVGRRPAWLPQFAAWILGGEMPQWALVRALMDAGAIERPPAALYYDAVLRTGTKPDALADSEVWEVLAFNGGEGTLKSADDNWGAGWAGAILARTRDGRMERDRVLDVVLAQLAGDLNAYRAGWYTGLRRALEPSVEEGDARHDALRVLLGSAAAPIVAFAVAQLLRTSRPVPPAELTPALTAKAKKTVRGGLKLLDRDPDARTATAALGHEAADVQGEVLDRLERWGSNGAGDALLAHLNLLAATQRPRAEALLGLDVPAAPESAPDVDADAIPPHIRLALNFGGPVPEAPVLGEPVLGAPLPPLEDLAGALAEALPEPWAYTDERLLDAILRACGSREAFDGPLRPFVKRLPEIDGWYASIATIAACWLSGEPPPPWRLRLVWDERLTEAGARAARGAAGPLLALPTHAGGWIAPAALAERLREAGDDVGEWDLAQALLRLAPGDPVGADVPGRPGALLRCAFGGERVDEKGPAADAARAVRDPCEFGVRIRLDATRAAHSGIEVAFARPRLSYGPLAIYVDDSGIWPGSTEPTVWPARRDLACAAAIGQLGWHLEAGPSDDSFESLLEALLDPSQPLPPLALRFAVLALCSSAERDHLLATDLLIAAIEDGRADAAGLIPGLRSDLGFVLTNRVGPRLATIAAAGPLHRAVVRDLLDGVIDALAALPPRSHAALLTVLDELCAATGTGVRSGRAFLETLTGSSRAARAARSLLARAGEPPASEATLALAARVRRAERWSTR